MLRALGVVSGLVEQDVARLTGPRPLLLCVCQTKIVFNLVRLNLLQGVGPALILGSGCEAVLTSTMSSS